MPLTYFLFFYVSKCGSIHKIKGWRHFVDNDISWTLFIKMGDISWTFFEGDFPWTFLVTSRGHFCPRNVT